MNCLFCHRQIHCTELTDNVGAYSCPFLICSEMSVYFRTLNNEIDYIHMSQTYKNNIYFLDQYPKSNKTVLGYYAPNGPVIISKMDFCSILTPESFKEKLSLYLIFS